MELQSKQPLQARLYLYLHQPLPWSSRLPTSSSSNLTHRTSCSSNSQSISTSTCRTSRTCRCKICKHSHKTSSSQWTWQQCNFKETMGISTSKRQGLINRQILKCREILRCRPTSRWTSRICRTWWDSSLWTSKTCNHNSSRTSIIIQLVQTRSITRLI